MKYIYEFIGTFFLVFTVGMTVVNPNGAGIMAPIAIGSVLAVMVYAGGHVSGGHYNPAVSLAVYLRRKLSTTDLWLYWAVQLFGAIIAGLFVIYFKGVPSQDIVQNLHIGKALLIEFLFAFALCFVVLNVATTKETKGNSFYGFAIGFIVLVGAYCISALSSAAFNPAVALGISIMNLSAWSNIWIYFVANLLGGVAAAYVFNIAHKDEYIQDRNSH